MRARPTLTDIISVTQINSFVWFDSAYVYMCTYFDAQLCNLIRALTFTSLQSSSSGSLSLYVTWVKGREAKRAREHNECVCACTFIRQRDTHMNRCTRIRISVCLCLYHFCTHVDSILLQQIYTRFVDCIADKNFFNFQRHFEIFKRIGCGQFTLYYIMYTISVYKYVYVYYVTEEHSVV